MNSGEEFLCWFRLHLSDNSASVLDPARCRARTSHPFEIVIFSLRRRTRKVPCQHHGNTATRIAAFIPALSRRLRVLTHPALLVVDEIGYLPVSQDGAVLFFQLVNARHERASTVLTSNKGFEEWGRVLGDEVMAAALIDRLVHHCHIVNIRGNSYRMRDHQNLMRSGPDRRRRKDGS